MTESRRPSLTPSERDVLTGTSLPATTPFVCRDRRIAREQWGAVELAGVTFEDVDFEDCSWTAPSLRSCLFRRVSFVRSALREARLSNVTFEACHFEETSWIFSEFDHCSFATGTLVECRALRCRLAHTEITDLEARSWELDETRLESCRFASSRLAAIRLTGSTLKDVSCSAGTLTGWTSTYTDLDGVSLHGTTVASVEIVGGVVESLAFEQLTGGDVLVAQVDVDRLRLAACEGLTFVRVADSEVRRIEIDGCASLDALTIHDCNLGSLVVKGSSLARLTLSDVDCAGPSSVEASEIAGWTFCDGTWSDLSVVDTSLREAFEATGTRFARLRFARSTAAPDLDLSTSDVDYLECPETWEAMARAD